VKKLLASLIIALPLLASADTVKLYEKDEVIPTYAAGPPDPNPMFYFGRESQGAQGRIYPYPLYDNLTNQKVNKTYHLVYLENQYIKVAIAPEIGGRLLSALDKTDNYDFIYHQHVIKPALIGLLGAWISGGIEWNIPHHHRATTFEPVQWTQESNADGSKTIWVGEMEIRDRMNWAVGYTLHPGSSLLTCRVRIINGTPSAHTMLCFANVAVSANNNYQIIFPPDTQWVTYHAKREFASWPIAHQRYSGADFTAGVDVSWWKNHINANSMFAWNYSDDFFGGYDHGKNAGIVSVADHHIVPGKKFWTWGSGPAGQLWNEILTDSDGPYIELMTGAYSDNQPDYSWLAPYETRAFDMNWYPVQKIDGFKNANLDAAANLDIKNSVATFGFCATKSYPSATATLSVAGKTLSEEKINIDPARPYTKQLNLPDNTSDQDVRISLSAGGHELIAYSPVKLAPMPMPAVSGTIPPPDELQNQEELFLAGQRVEQFHDAHHDPEDYWSEALKRDSGDIDANTGLGILDLQCARFSDAEAHFRKALERLTAHYTTPKNAEPEYYLGITLQAEDKTDEAFDILYKAAWSQEWKSPAYFALAQIATVRGDFPAALEYVEHSLEANSLNLRASTLKIAILRHLGRDKDAANIPKTAAQSIDPLDPGLLAESWLTSHDQASARQLFTTLNTFPTTAQEVAAELLDAGLLKDGAEVLNQFIAAAPDKSKISPLIYYYLGEFAGRQGDKDDAKKYRETAAHQPSDYVFPFQSEMVAVLRDAIAANPKDARAMYYLGDLLFDWQPHEAISLWEQSVAIEPNFPIAWRNLAQAYSHQDTDEARAKAMGYLEKAISLSDNDPTHYAELDRLYQQTGVPVEKRLSLLEQQKPVIMQEDESLADFIGLKTFTGHPEEAIALLKKHTFNIWEGATAFNTGQAWKDAWLVSGLKSLNSKDYSTAIADFKKASDLPVNLRAQQPTPADRAELGYWTGVAFSESGASGISMAVASWEALLPPNGTPASNPRRRDDPLTREPQKYYRALAEQNLKAPDTDPSTMFESIVTTGTSALADSNNPSRAHIAMAHYIAGLGYTGLKEKDNARREFTAALAAQPDDLAAKLALDQLDAP
jgi:tetratricopeptide (TPR) repeat protein